MQSKSGAPPPTVTAVVPPPTDLLNASSSPLAPPRLPLSADDDEEIRLLVSHLNLEPPPPPTVPLYALPDQEYLEATILPLLLRGLEELSKVRPPDPLTFLAAYLIGNNPQRSAVPLLNDPDGRRVPLMDIALKAAAGFEVSQTAGGKDPGCEDTLVSNQTNSVIPPK